MTASARIGILNDVADFAGDEDQTRDLTFWIERECAALRASGRLNVAVEFVHAYGLGLPTGTAEALEGAFATLAGAGACMVVGPSTGENALALMAMADRTHIPTLAPASSERARSPYMFQYQTGSDEEEGLVIARHLATLGARRIAAFHAMSPAGERHLRSLRAEAEVLGLDLALVHALCPTGSDDEIGPALAALLESGAEGLAVLGPDMPVGAIAHALDLTAWDGARMTGTPGIRGWSGRDIAALQGWFHVSSHSDANRRLSAIVAETGSDPAGNEDMAAHLASGHDIGRLVAEALARAQGTDGEAVRRGLEQVRALPAASGEDGTLLGFGPQDRGALHGRHLIVRQWRDGISHEFDGARDMLEA